MNKVLNGLVYLYFRVAIRVQQRIADFRRRSTLSKYINYNYLNIHGVKTAFGSVSLVGLPIIKRFPGSAIIIGKNVTLVSNSRGNPAGINHPVILATLTEAAELRIGNGCGMSGSAVCAATRVDIGDFSGLGANATIYDTDFHSISDFGTDADGIHGAKSRPVLIGKKVWIGGSALILKGVSIGDNAVIGAGAVVRENVSPGVVVVGNPCKVFYQNE